MADCTLAEPCHRRGCAACYPERAGHIRLLWTASRDWTDPLDMWCLLEEWHAYARVRGLTLVLVHGDAPGGDQIAKLFALLTDGCEQEPWPADWEGPCDPDRCRPGHRRRGRRGRGYCPAAGMYRNEAMVDAGADRCAAWIKDRSPGATGCAQMARRAGISTKPFTASSSPTTKEA